MLGRTPRGRTLSILLLLLTMAIWGSTYVVTKSGLDELPPMRFAFLRFCVASALLVPLALARGGLRALPRPTPWGTLAVMGLTGVGLYYVFFNLGLSYTTASQGALVQASIPAITAALAVLWLGERLSRRRMAGIVLAVSGVLLIVARSAPDESATAPLLGNLLMFASVVVWGIYTVLAKRIADVDPIAMTATISVLGTLALLVAALVEIGRVPIVAISAGGWLRIIYLGAAASAASYLFYSRALRDLDAMQVGIFINLVPVLGVASGVVVLGETVTALAIVGGLLVLAGVWISSRDHAAGQATE
jgi:drug/metabolite transporter (DMT)-like permease